MLLRASFGNHMAAEHDFWSAVIKMHYQGDDGRRRIRVATANLLERESLHERLSDVRCPVLWIQVCTARAVTIWGETHVVYREPKTPFILLQTQPRRFPYSLGRQMLAWWSWMAVHTSSTVLILRL